MDKQEVDKTVPYKYNNGVLGVSVCRFPATTNRECQITRSWIKDGVTVCKTDDLKISNDDNNCHPENKLKTTEFHTIRDGEIIARLWWIR